MVFLCNVESCRIPGMVQFFVQIVRSKLLINLCMTEWTLVSFPRGDYMLAFSYALIGSNSVQEVQPYAQIFLSISVVLCSCCLTRLTTVFTEQRIKLQQQA